MNNKEGAKPHLHFEQNKDYGCIRIDTDELFNHEEGMKRTLNTTEKRKLGIWFSLPNEKFPKMTNYQFVCLRWNQKNIDANPKNINGKRLDINNKISPFAIYLTQDDINKLKKIKNYAYYQETKQ